MGAGAQGGQRRCSRSGALPHPPLGSARPHRPIPTLIRSSHNVGQAKPNVGKRRGSEKPALLCGDYPAEPLAAGDAKLELTAGAAASAQPAAPRRPRDGPETAPAQQTQPQKLKSFTNSRSAAQVATFNGCRVSLAGVATWPRIFISPFPTPCPAVDSLQPRGKHEPTAPVPGTTRCSLQTALGEHCEKAGPWENAYFYVLREVLSWFGSTGSCYGQLLPRVTSDSYGYTRRYSARPPLCFNARTRGLP